MSAPCGASNRSQRCVRWHPGRTWQTADGRWREHPNRHFRASALLYALRVSLATPPALWEEAVERTGRNGSMSSMRATISYTFPLLRWSPGASSSPFPCSVRHSAELGNLLVAGSRREMEAAREGETRKRKVALSHVVRDENSRWRLGCEREENFCLLMLLLEASDCRPRKSPEEFSNLGCHPRHPLVKVQIVR